MFKHKICKKVWKHTNLVTYHTNVLVAKNFGESFYRPLRKSSEHYLKKIGQKGRLIVKALMKIPGITEVKIFSYEIRVEIGEAFSLPKVMEKIEKVLLEQIVPESRREGFEIETLK